MNNAERKAFFRVNRSRQHLWLVVLLLQLLGLGLVIAAMPVQLVSVVSQNVPASLGVLQNKEHVIALTSIFFGLLAGLNILAVIGIWRLHRWVKYYLIVKLVVSVLLILSVFLLVNDYILLVIYAGLFCSLVCMTWVYSVLQMHLKSPK